MSETTKTANPNPQVIYVKTDDKVIRNATIRGILIGAVISGTVVAAVKDDSETIREIGKTITTIATSYYGCKFIYNLFS